MFGSCCSHLLFGLNLLFSFWTDIEEKGMCFCMGIIGYYDIVFLNFSFVGIAALRFS